KTRNLARLIDLWQRQTRQWQSGRCPRDRNFRFDIVPAPQQFTPEFSIGAGTLYLIENEPVVLLDRLNDLSKLAHLFLSTVVEALVPSAYFWATAFDTNAATTRFARLTQIIHPRQDRDAVLRRYQSAADYADFVPGVVRFPCARCGRAGDRFCSPPRCRRDQASRFFAI